MNDEEWKIITGYSRYSISNLGRIKINENNKIRKATLGSNYYRINLILDSTKKRICKHSLTFIVVV